MPGRSTPISSPASVSTSAIASTMASRTVASLISGGAIWSTASPRSSARAISPASSSRPGRKPRGGLVLDELDGPEEARSADVADDRQRAQLLQARLEVALERAHVLQHVV